MSINEELASSALPITVALYALKLCERFKRTGSMDDLNGAIAMNEELTPEDHPFRVMCLNNLGSGLRTRFESTGSMDDLNRAVTMNEQAVASTLLGSALQTRFERTGSTEDLNRAIATKEQAVA